MPILIISPADGFLPMFCIIRGALLNIPPIIFIAYIHRQNLAILERDCVSVIRNATPVGLASALVFTQTLPCPR